MIENQEKEPARVGYGAYPGYGYGTPAPTGVSIQLLWDVLRKRWAMILVSASVIIGFVSYQTARQPYYFQATAKVIFSPQDFSPATTQQNPMARTNMMVPPAVLVTQEAVIQSDSVIERVVQSLNLAQREKDPKRFDAEVRRVKGMVGVSRGTDSQIFLVTATAGEPEQAMLVANSVAEAYIKYNYDRTLATYRKSVSWLSDELVELEKKLEEAQKELISFIEKEKLTNFGDENSPTVARFEISPEEDSSLLRKLINERGNLELELSQLLKRYREAHPKVKKVRDDLAAVEQKVFEESKRVGRAKDVRTKEVIGSKQKEIKYSILMRKVDINKQLYNTLIKKLKETDIDSAVIHNNVDVLEYAKVPGGPAGPNKKQRILFAVLFGALFSIGLAMLLEFMDTSIRSVDEIQSYLRLPVLAAIPRIEAGRPDGEMPLLSELRPESPLREAYRTLRTNIRFSASTDQGRLLMVTSCEKGEGKSTIAANIGIVNAESGKKTLLVDGDFRVHSLTHILNVPNERGLTQYLTEGEALNKLVLPTTRENLFILPSGPQPPKPAVLLESDRMRQLIEEMKKDFDQIVIDAPPVALVVDPVLISHHVDGVVLVVEAGRVSRTHISKTVEQLLRVKANLFGVVLNKEERRGKSYYAYRGYYAYAREET